MTFNLLKWYTVKSPTFMSPYRKKSKNDQLSFKFVIVVSTLWAVLKLRFRTCVLQCFWFFSKRNQNRVNPTDHIGSAWKAPKITTRKLQSYLSSNAIEAVIRFIWSEIVSMNCLRLFTRTSEDVSKGNERIVFSINQRATGSGQERNVNGNKKNGGRDYRE